ncbi:MAG: phytoene/squalene synthase family protein [Planctomycetota bacterium]
MADGSISTPTAPQVDAALAHTRAIAKRHAKNFYYGMRLTPEPKRSALYAVYAWMRAADATGDGPVAVPDDDQHVGGDLSRRLAAWEAFREQTVAALNPALPLPNGDVWTALRYVRQRFALPGAPLWGMLDGQRDDLTHRGFDDFDGLYAYCARVASTVGTVCVHLWGHDGDPAVAQLTEYRGIALQLTNIIRDVREDAMRGRLYLPREDLERFNLTPPTMFDPSESETWTRLLRFQIERARSYYEMSDALESHLSPDCRRSSAVIAGVYRALLERIATKPEAVLQRRVRLPGWRKLWLMGSALR